MSLRWLQDESIWKYTDKFQKKYLKFKGRIVYETRKKISKRIIKRRAALNNYRQIPGKIAEIRIKNST